MVERKRKHWLHSAAVLLGPFSFAIAIALLQGYFGFKAGAAAGTALWMALWWILRPVHIAVTALIPIVVNALFDLVPMTHVVQQYFSEIIVLLFGADLICLTWATTGLDKRLALKTLCCIGPSIKQQIGVWLLSSTVLSVFLPNVVVCTIMVPVAVSMLHFIGEETIKTSKVAPPILLAIVWGAGIGGFGSPLGGAANLVAINYLEKLTGQEFMYVDWLARFLPFLVLVVLLNWLYLLHLPMPIKHLAGTRQYFKEMYAQLGRMRFGEKISLTLFVAATLLAFMRPLFASWLPALKPAYVFLTIGFLAFILESEDGKPLLTWEFAEDGVMWGMLFLFAGGLALGTLVTESGAALKLAEVITLLPLTGGIETVFSFTLFSAVLTEVSSNTAAAAIAVPVVESISQTLGLNPIPYLLVSIVALNSAYMLPVSIRAIPVSFGLDPAELFKKGLQLAVYSTALITVIGYLSIKYWALFQNI